MNDWDMAISSIWVAEYLPEFYIHFSSLCYWQPKKLPLIPQIFLHLGPEKLRFFLRNQKIKLLSTIVQQVSLHFLILQITTGYKCKETRDLAA